MNAMGEAWRCRLPPGAPHRKPVLPGHQPPGMVRRTQGGLPQVDVTALLTVTGAGCRVVRHGDRAYRSGFAARFQSWARCQAK